MRIWAVLGFVFCLYVIGIFGSLIQDDLVVVSADRSLNSWSGLLRAMGEPYYKDSPQSGSYRPIPTTSFVLNKLFLGESAWGFRLVNISLYLVLVWLIFKYLAGIFKENWALGLTILFAVHPIHTEAVNNIVGRAEIMALIFGLSALLMARKQKWEWSVVSLLLAMWAKESAVIFAPLLGLTIWQSKFGKREKVGVLLYLGLAFLFYLATRWIVLGEHFLGNNATMVENPLKFLSSEKRVLGAISVLVFGLGKVLWPVNLSYDYSFSAINYATNLVDIRVMIGILLFALSLGWIVRMKKREYFEAWSLFWGPLLITGNILFASGTIMGERLWLVPSLGFLMMVGLFIRELKWSEKKFVYLLILLTIFWSGRTFLRNFDWLSQKRLFLHDAKYASQSVMVRSNEAAMYIENGNLDKGYEALSAGEKIYPDYPELINNWGVYYWRKGEFRKAKEKLEECVKAHPDNPTCVHNLFSLSQEMNAKK